jgi:RimJ/RimL family protein N-acetyltransferase
VPDLVAPAVRLHLPWLEAHAEWGPGLHEDGFGVSPSDELSSPAGFAGWVAALLGSRTCSYRWIVEDGRVLGGITLRHGYDDITRRLGHIGYGIRPSARRRGLATWALGEILVEARTRGLGEVLIVCETGNLASARTVEHHGGILADGTDQGVRRYWVKLAG